MVILYHLVKADQQMKNEIKKEKTRLKQLDLAENFERYQR